MPKGTKLSPCLQRRSERMLEFVGIKAGGGFVAWNNEIRCIGMLFISSSGFTASCTGSINNEPRSFDNTPAGGSKDFAGLSVQCPADVPYLCGVESKRMQDLK